MSTILREHFEKFITLNDAEFIYLLSHFSFKKVKRRRILLEQGDMVNNDYFVLSGCLKSYTVDDFGKEHILQFALEGWWIADMYSFLTGEPSTYDIDALEDTVVLRISYEDLIDLYMKAPKFDRIFRVLLENHFMQQQDRIGQLFSSTAEERYQSFLETYPHLQNRLSQVQIAAYLGVTPEFLSRIRSRMAKGDRQS